MNSTKSNSIDELDGVQVKPVKNNGSREIVFDSVSRKKKDKIPTGTHEATFSIVISMSIPNASPDTNFYSNSSTETTNVSKKKLATDNTKPLNYYHFEYGMLSNEESDLTKTDIVYFGHAAKFFVDKQDSKVLKTFQTADSTWIAWTHNHTIPMTDLNVEKLHDHVLEFKVWNQKDKCSYKAKFDRPKAFKMPKENEFVNLDHLVVPNSFNEHGKQLSSDKPSVSLDETEDILNSYNSGTTLNSKSKDNSLASNTALGNDDSNVGVGALVSKQIQSFIDYTPKKLYLHKDLPETFNYDKSKKNNAKYRWRYSYPIPSYGLNTNTAVLLLYKKPRLFKKNINGVFVVLESYNAETEQQQQINMGSNPATAASFRKSASSKLSVSSGIQVPNINDEVGIVYENLENLADGNMNDSEEENDLNGFNKQPPSPGLDKNIKFKQKVFTTKSVENHKSRLEQKNRKKLDLEEMERIKKEGLACIRMNMAEFFSPGTKTYSRRLSDNVNGIIDMFVTITLNTPLLSQEQIEKFNPLSIKIHCAKNLPNKPYDYKTLREMCEPVYTISRFIGISNHRSEGVLQDHSVYFDDSVVVLLGKLDKSKLREYLQGPHMEVEVHDRDRKVNRCNVSKKAALFGNDVDDEKISNVGVASAKRTLYNPFEASERKPWDPYGIAKFDLSGLLLGQKVLFLQSNILPCKIPDVLGSDMKDNKLIGVKGAVDGPELGPLQQADFLSNGSILKIKVEVTKLLVCDDEIDKRTDRKFSSAVSFNYKDISPHCPFNRIVYIFNNEDNEFLNRLMDEITRINCEALNIHSDNISIVKAALSTYKLSVQEQQDSNLDVITGFHIVDKFRHIIVIEGLAMKSIDEVFANVPKESNSKKRILYNSDQRFTDRLYGALDVGMTRIKLHEPLDSIIKQPLLYVRDMVPKECFDCIIKLSQILDCVKIRQISKNDLWPTVDMILKLSKEFGVPLSRQDFIEMEGLSPQKEVTKVTSANTPRLHESTRTTNKSALDNTNVDYIVELAKRNISKKDKDYMAEYRNLLFEKSELNAKQRTKTAPPRFYIQTPAVHNYSCHTFNQVELAKEQLRLLIQKDEMQRQFTYCPDFHQSGSVFPYDFDDELRRENFEKREEWRTEKGWIYPGCPRMIDANRHPRRPDKSRIVELKNEWEENSLHTNKFVAPVSDRECFPWNYRNYDFNMWSKPETIDKGVPSIHEPGVKASKEKLDIKRTESVKWKEKLVVDNERMEFYRKNVQTEAIIGGSKSANQLERTVGLLKSQPKRKCLMGTTAKICSVPPFSVVSNPSVDTRQRKIDGDFSPAIENEFSNYNMGFIPGENGRSLNIDAIPRPTYDRNCFPIGIDFDPKVQSKEKLHKRIAKSLNESEYETNNLFKANPAYHNGLQAPNQQELQDFYQLLNCNSTSNSGNILPPIRSQ